MNDDNNQESDRDDLSSCIPELHNAHIDVDHFDTSVSHNKNDDLVRQGSFCKSLNEKYSHYEKISFDMRQTLTHSSSPKMNLDDAVHEVNLSALHDGDSQLEDDFRFDSDFKLETKKKNFSLNFSEINKRECFEDEFNKEVEMFSQSWRDEMEKNKRF